MPAASRIALRYDLSVSPRSLSFDFDPKTPPEPKEVVPPKQSDRGPSDEGPRALTVGELSRVIRDAVEGPFVQAVWVEGEVVGVRAAPSGHLYLCLRDDKEDASIDAVMYRTNITQRARKLLVDGARVRLRGRPTYWSPRGRLQFVGDRAEAVGKGALLEALEKLKEKLATEGLFSQERKRALPSEPRVVGVVTSSAGAVIHDVCKVSFRRGGARILLAPAVVQGVGAAESICRALIQLQRLPDVDVIILGRGGGSSDDLAAFNDEAVVRAVAACRVPIVSAVGHEVDVTLTDFAADARAATPSQAAEMVVPDMRAKRSVLAQTHARLVRAVRGRVTESRVEWMHAARALGDPRLLLAGHQQLVDDRLARLTRVGRNLVERRRKTVLEIRHRLTVMHPSAVIARERTALHRMTSRLATLAHKRIDREKSQIGTKIARLDALSPLKVLARGYAIALGPDGKAIRSSEDANVGDTIRVRVEKAEIAAVVKSKEPIS